MSYFPFMSIKKVVPYFCVLREGYYVIIWPIVRICVFIKDWKLIYSELFILKRESMENWGGGGSHIANNRNWSVSKVRKAVLTPLVEPVKSCRKHILDDRIFPLFYNPYHYSIYFEFQNLCIKKGSKYPRSNYAC